MIYAALGYAAIATISIVVMAYWLRSSTERAFVHAQEQLRAERVMDAAVAERDAATVKATTAQSALDRSIAQLADTQRALNAAKLELGKVIQSRALTASPEEVIAIVNDLLKVPLSEQPGTELEKPE